MLLREGDIFKYILRLFFMNLENLNNKIKNCNNCILHRKRKNTVPGEGGINAKVIFIGEAPGKKEDETGRPFVGRGGKLLRELIKEINLDEKDVFITSILKCRPPENRNPKKEEIIACEFYLWKQIEIIKPKLICTLGNFSTKLILEKYGFEFQGITKSHGKIFNVDKNKIMPLFHPAYILRGKPSRLPLMKKDFKRIKKLIK